MKLIAALFGLLFIQDLGIPLWYHELAHKQSSEKIANTSTQVHISCSCFSDFFTAAIPSENIVFEVKAITFCLYNNYYQTLFITLNDKNLSFLRGPPASSYLFV